VFITFFWVVNLEQSTLIPFVRENLDVLFIGLNPAKGSSQNRHYFSVNQSFWNQLFESGLIISPVEKSIADEIVFGDTKINFLGWSFGITDLVTEIAESDSRKIKPSNKDCENLSKLIKINSPKSAILLHNKVLRTFLRYAKAPLPASNSGYLGTIIPNCPTVFFNIAFPHGSSLPSKAIVEQYKQVKNYLEGANNPSGNARDIIY
jgi:hypothetical protein